MAFLTLTKASNLTLCAITYITIFKRFLNCFRCLLIRKLGITQHLNLAYVALLVRVKTSISSFGCSDSLATLKFPGCFNALLEFWKDFEIFTICVVSTESAKEHQMLSFDFSHFKAKDMMHHQDCPV